MSIYKGTDFVAGTPDMSAYMTTNALLEAIYPVGSIYIGTQATCPLATLISGSTWELVAQNRALWGGDGTNANTTIAAGLPNITGSLTGAGYRTSGNVSYDGVFSTSVISDESYSGYSSFSGKIISPLKFNASNSNSIYGNSTTVQPPAYVVNIWRRTA